MIPIKDMLCFAAIWNVGSLRFREEYIQSHCKRGEMRQRNLLLETSSVNFVAGEVR